MGLKRDSSYGYFKSLLLLGRVSNLPTVWSNCLASWLLAGGTLLETTDLQRFSWLIVGATLLYLAGMFLNDAFDVRFDKEHRTERPIPSGAISDKAVWVWGIIQMVLGLGCLIWIGPVVAVCAFALAGSVLWYDWIHKRIAWSPLIMGLCRLSLYVLAGAAAAESEDMFPPVKDGSTESEDGKSEAAVEDDDDSLSHQNVSKESSDESDLTEGEDEETKSSDAEDTGSKRRRAVRRRGNDGE